MTSKLKEHKKISDFVSPGLKTHPPMVYSFNDISVDLNDLGQQIKAETGLKLVAEFEGDSVDGFLTSSSNTYPTDTVCKWCEDMVPAGVRHQCVIVTLYDENVAPNHDPVLDPNAKRTHKSRLNKVTIRPDTHNKLEGAFNKHHDKRRLQIEKEFAKK